LTALLPLWPAGSQPSPRRGSRAARYRAPQAELRATRRLGRRFRPFQRRAGSASDALCRARCRPSLRTTFPGSQDRRLRSSRQRGRRTSIQRVFPPLSGPIHARLRRRFRCRSPASCNRYDSRARLHGPHRARSRTCEVALTRRGAAAALLRAPPAGASRSRGPVAALAASASSRQCLEELPRNRSLPSTSLHEPVPRTGWRSRPRAASPPRERDHPRAPLARDPRCHATRRLRGRSSSRFWPRPDHVTEGRPSCRPREGGPDSPHPRCLLADEKDPLCTCLTHRLSPTCGV